MSGDNDSVKCVIFTKKKIRKLKCLLGWHEWKKATPGRRRGESIWLVECRNCCVAGKRKIGLSMCRRTMRL